MTPTRIIAARDPIGVTTLYQGWNSKRPGATYFSSELKSIVDECDEIISFPPGHVYDSRDKSTTQYFQPSWWSGDEENGRIASLPVDFKLLRETLEASVRKRLMAEVPYGVLLSGGLDSSLIASIATREAQKLAEAKSAIRQNGANGPTTNGASSDRGKSELSTSFVPLILTSSNLTNNQGICTSTRSQLGWNTRPTLLPQGKLLRFWELPITSSCSLFKRD